MLAFAMRLTWRKEPSETGLARVTQSPRGAILKVEGVDVGHVYANRVAWQQFRGWYWVASGPGIPLKNTCGSPVETIAIAKVQCTSYVRECLEKSMEKPK
jgi:hypothetical protein